MPRQHTSHIIIHCSATRPSQDIDAKEIDRWHRARGFLEIGYHFVIKRDGTIEEGRTIQETGAHAKKYNHKSIGICLVGGVTEDYIKIPENNFLEPQWKSLKEVLSNLKLMFPDAITIGHNQVSEKACPSFDVQEWLKENDFDYCKCKDPDCNCKEND